MGSQGNSIWYLVYHLNEGELAKRVLKVSRIMKLANCLITVWRAFKGAKGQDTWEILAFKSDILSII